MLNATRACCTPVPVFSRCHNNRPHLVVRRIPFVDVRYCSLQKTFTNAKVFRPSYFGGPRNNQLMPCDRSQSGLKMVTGAWHEIIFSWSPRFGRFEFEFLVQQSKLIGPYFAVSLVDERFHFRAFFWLGKRQTKNVFRRDGGKEKYIFFVWRDCIQCFRDFLYYYARYTSLDGAP